MTCANAQISALCERLIQARRSLECSVRRIVRHVPLHFLWLADWR